MNPENIVHGVFTPEEGEKIIRNGENVRFESELLSGNIVLSYSKTNDNDKEFLQLNNNVSVGLASAIAAYSRIEMSKYIRKYSNHLVAIDTDGIKITTTLPKHLVDSKRLGKMKYEYSLKQGVFPIAKVHGGILTKPYKSCTNELVKIKGLKNVISYNYLKQIININNTLDSYEERWFKKIRSIHNYSKGTENYSKNKCK